jgi:tetratricopeptide (TPR) repeat protein
MKVLATFLLLALGSQTFAQYSPQRYVVPEAETKLRADLANAPDDNTRKEFALAALANYPDDVSLGRIAQDALLPVLENPKEWFAARSHEVKTSAASYLYARAANDAMVTDSVADKILADNPDDYWGLRLKGVAIGAVYPDSLPAVIRLMEHAARVKPDRPDTYLYIGFYYKQLGEDEKSIAAFEAGAVSDPSDKIIRDFRLTYYATHKQAEKYFALVPTALPKAPMEWDVSLAKDGSMLTKESFLGHYSIVECWTYL